MHEIKCPNCGETFKVDESNYAAILSQVRTQEFEKDIDEKIAQLHKQHETDLKLHEEQIKNKIQEELSKKDKEILSLKNELENRGKELVSAKNAEIANLEAKKNEEITKLKAELANSDIAKELAISKAIQPYKEERDQLKSDLRANEDKYKGALQFKEEEIERLKDFKEKLSTKMVGETLEQHCEIEFNKLRATGFQNAYFEKDNKISGTGSKGDYIFRDIDENGTEIISIMFEMKNENDTTSTKHKNEDFFKELDKDRREKNCEYAILVSRLELDNELYNTGIVDVSYRFPKMYVIRPQFFIPMITLLRNAALNSLKDKNELIAMKNQEIDITNFENEVFNFKKSLGNTLKNFYNKHSEAIEQINKAIKDLEKTRDALMLSDKHINTAEDKLGDLSIKRLTRGNPTMAEKFSKLNDK